MWGVRVIDQGEQHTHILGRPKQDKTKYQDQEKPKTKTEDMTRQDVARQHKTNFVIAYYVTAEVNKTK